MVSRWPTSLIVAATLACVSRPAVPDAPVALAAVETTPSLTAAPDQFFTCADARIRSETSDGGSRSC